MCASTSSTPGVSPPLRRSRPLTSSSPPSAHIFDNACAPSTGKSGIALATSAAVLFGASIPASKLLLESLGPFQLAGLLYLGAVVGVEPLLGREKRRQRRPLDRHRNGNRQSTAI